MAHVPFGWMTMDPAAAAAALAGKLPPPFHVAAANGAMYCLDPALYASFVSPGGRQQPTATPTAVEVARRHQEEEAASIHLVHLLITCTGAIQAGDHSAAHANLAKARQILEVITTSAGIGRVASHFADALAQRLFPAHPHMAPPLTAPEDLHSHLYDVGPYLKFAYSTANQAMLDAFEGSDRVHIVDFALMEGLQWPSLIHAMSKRDGGPPYLRITGIGPRPTSGGDKLNEVGVRLTELALSLHIPFSFQAIYSDQLDELSDWMLKLVPGEALGFNSILQLHRLLVDPDVDSAVPAPIDVLLRWVVHLKPRIFTVVEQEADHNRPQLLERFTNALFHYASMFDSMEAMASHRAAGGGGSSSTHSLAEACLRNEIFDIVCGEGSARTERHEMLGRWRERLARAGLVQVPFGPNEVRLATAQLIHATSFNGSGYTILECAGSLALAWHNRPLYVATAWHATGGNAAGAMADTERLDPGRRGRNSSIGKGKKPATAHGSAGGIVML